MLLKDRIKVLLVEDNPGDAQLIKEALKESSYREATLFLADSIAGAKQFSTENILLLLLDLGLPDSNGLDTIQFIRNDFPDSALIILTGLDDEKVAIEALRLGAQNYLTKDGINADTLSRTIRYSLERHDFIERLKAKQEELTLSNLLLEKSEKHFRALIENSTDGITVISAEGIVLDMSPSGRKILGYHENEIIGKNRPDLIHQEDQKIVFKAFDDIIADPANIKLIEYRHQMPDGSYKWLECSFKNLLSEPHLNAIVLNYRDITERKMTERKLADSEFQYRSLIEQATDAIFIANREGKYIDVNTSTSTLLGYSREELLTMSGRDILFHEENIKLLPQRYQTLKAGKSGITEIRLKRKDGSPVDVETNSKMLTDGRFVGIARDITARKKAEHEMALLINNTEESFILMDRNLTIVSFNHQFFNLYKKYFGLTLQKGDSILAYAQPERKASVEILYEKVLAGGSEKSEITVPLLNEESKMFSIKYIPAKDDSNNIIGVFVTAVDITELKKAEGLKEFERRDKEALINGTDDFIWSVTKDYKLIAANHAFLYSMHLSSKVMLKPGDSLMQHGIIPPATLAFWKDLYDQALSGKSFKREIHNPPSLESEEFWMETSFNPILKEDQVEAIACYARNITEKKIADDLLRQSEARLTEAQAVAKVGSWETDLVTLHVIWSLETYRIFELDPESFQVTYTAFLEHVHSEDSALVDNAFKESFQKDDFNTIQHRVITPNGNIKWVEERWIIFHDSQGNPFRAVGTTQDITVRKTAEEKILRSEAELREAQKLAQLGSWNFDFEADRLTWSDELYNVFDTDHNTFLETHGSFVHLVEEQDKDFVRQTSLRTQKDGIPFDIEYHITTAAGEKRVIHERGYAERNKEGKIIRLFGTAQNITESKKAQEQIKTEKLFSDALINSLPGIFYLNDQDGRFARWNKNFETISGYTAEEINHMHLLDFYDADERKLVKRKIEKVFSDGDEEITAHFYTKDKKKIPYYFHCHKISIHGNDYLIGVGIDVSEQTRAQQKLVAYTEEIKRLTAHLEQVREEERSRIAREIHDELGQQITGLKMDASWLSNKIGRDEKALHEKLASMILLMDHSVQTVRRISSDLRPGILDDLGLIAALEWQSDEFEKRSEIKCEFKSDVEEVDINRLLAIGIFRIYQEALTNVMRHAKASRIEASIKITETDFALIIKDNGQGFNTKNAKEEKTLGLIGMRERALMAGGELHISSEINKGATIMLTIPLSVINSKT